MFFFITHLLHLVYNIFVGHYFITISINQRTNCLIAWKATTVTTPVSFRDVQLKALNVAAPKKLECSKKYTGCIAYSLYGCILMHVLSSLVTTERKKKQNTIWTVSQILGAKKVYRTIFIRTLKLRFTLTQVPKWSYGLAVRRYCLSESFWSHTINSVSQVFLRPHMNIQLQKCIVAME